MELVYVCPMYNKRFSQFSSVSAYINVYNSHVLLISCVNELKYPKEIPSRGPLISNCRLQNREQVSLNIQICKTFLISFFRNTLYTECKRRNFLYYCTYNIKVFQD